MADLWSYFKTLFRQAKSSTPANPLVHELIVRSPQEKVDYAQWRETLVFQRMKQWVRDQYGLFCTQPEDVSEPLQFLDTAPNLGFALYFHQTGYTAREATHFLDYLKEQVLHMDYRVQVSDLRTYERPNWVETVQRHYLKPRPVICTDQKLRQRFGNITIDLLLRDEAPYLLRFRATAYRDHLFQEPESFAQLMRELFPDTTP